MQLQMAGAIFFHHQRQYRFVARLEHARRERERTMLIGVNWLGERHSTILFQPRDAHLFFIGAEHKNFRPTIAVPIRHCNLRDAAEAGESARTGKRAALGLRL